MEEILLENGDQVPNGAGDFCRLEGAQALVQRVLFRLRARRGSFPFLPETGSLLHQLSREKPSARGALCEQYVRQALEEEDVQVTGVAYEDGGGEQAQVTVSLLWNGEPLSVSAWIGGKDENH